MTIDAVITWVDGNDPVLNAKRRQYGTSYQLSHDAVGGEARYANVGEIFWCVASINRFAPWIRKIFLITDGQNPHLEPFLEKHFPNGYIPIEIVDHTTIFKGYEQFLPTFNSISIETMMWRIPGLSERFVYFNDDLVLLRPHTPDDFFTEDGIVSFSRWRPVLREQINHFLHVGSANYWTMALAAQMLHSRRYLKLYHVSRGLMKSWFECYFQEHPDYLIKNIQHRFRNEEQFSIMELEYIALANQQRNKVLSAKGYYFYLKPKKKPNYVQRKIAKMQSGNYGSCCFNSIELASKDDQALVFDYLRQLFQLSAD